MLVRQLIETGMLTGKPEQHEAGNCLFRAGEAIEYFYFLMSGSVCQTPAVDIPSPSVASGNILLGLPDLLSETHTLTATVLETSNLVRIRRGDILQALQQNPHLRLHLLRQMSRQNTLTQAAYE